MLSIDTFKSGIDYRTIGETYGYKPGKPESTDSDLEISWKDGKEIRMRKEYHAMQNVLSHERTNGKEEVDRAMIKTNQGNIWLDANIWKFPDQRMGTEKLDLILISNKGKIGEYVAWKKGTIWNLVHRIVAEEYRGKNIGKHLLEAAENCIQAYADETKDDQEIVVECGQLNVINFFLKNGYQIAEEDEGRFADTIGRLLAGDPHFTVASSRPSTNSGAEQKTWYLFESETLERMGEKIWEYDDKAKKSNFVLHSIRFKLFKKIKAKNSKIRTGQNETSTAVEAAIK